MQLLVTLHLTFQFISPPITTTLLNITNWMLVTKCYCHWIKQHNLSLHSDISVFFLVLLIINSKVFFNFSVPLCHPWYSWNQFRIILWIHYFSSLIAFLHHLLTLQKYKYSGSLSLLYIIIYCTWFKTYHPYKGIQDFFACCFVFISTALCYTTSTLFSVKNEW